MHYGWEFNGAVARRYIVEPTAEDLLADPLVRIVMAGDNVAESEVRAALAHARSALAGPGAAERGL